MAVGIAGSFALVRRDVSNILAGVAIAISLVPVLAVVGITLGSGRLDLAWGAFLLFLANAAAIIIAGVLVFTAAGYTRVAAARGRQPRRRAKVIITVFVVLLLIPLAGASFRTLEYELWMRTTDDVAHTWVKGTDWKVDSVKQAGSDIVILVVGQGDTPPIDALRAAVRRNVPRSVDVLVIEESGKTTAL